ncbi:MAG TPA: hypothetical protein DDX51_07045 [Clostridiales bacterium]|nr:hypothetical protein [Clostridiales bacterium]
MHQKHVPDVGKPKEPSYFMIFLQGGKQIMNLQNMSGLIALQRKMAWAEQWSGYLVRLRQCQPMIYQMYKVGWSLTQHF